MISIRVLAENKTFLDRQMAEVTYQRLMQIVPQAWDVTVEAAGSPELGKYGPPYMSPMVVVEVDGAEFDVLINDRVYKTSQLDSDLLEYWWNTLDRFIHWIEGRLNAQT